MNDRNINTNFEHHATSDDSTSSAQIRMWTQTAPSPGVAVAVVPGLWWARLPLSSSIAHVNVYLLEDEDHELTLVDTGSRTDACRAALSNLLSSDPFAEKKVTRLLVTHYHPDHIGLAGEWCGEVESSIPGSGNVELWCTRTSWLTARMGQMDRRAVPHDRQIEFVERAGMRGMSLAAFRRHPPSSFPDLVAPVPFRYRRIQEGDVLKIGTRQWTVSVGHGHAAEHATLWSNDGLAITGDQILPGVSSNLSVSASEPEADLVTEWLESCRKFQRMASSDTLCLPGHHFPFYGIAQRCQQMMDTTESILVRLWENLRRPQTAMDCLPTVYRRQLKPAEIGPFLAETTGFLHHLYKQQRVRREMAAGGVYLWRQSPSSDAPRNSLHRIDSAEGRELSPHVVRDVEAK